ncbi:9471_t:CDS:2 [Entrophospora sp. SA101]|nr:9471_t:CDS:2 [Entrophospora sp. SA101]
MRRVVVKSEIIHWNKGESDNGKFFTVLLVDKSCEIRATAFNDCVDKFYNQLNRDEV